MAEAMDLAEIYKAYMADPQFEHLRKSQHFVPGSGALGTVMFIGEAPGEEEDKLREPFVGKSGHVLEERLAALRMTRDEVFLTNVLKYRPSRFNRDPSPTEVLASLPYLSEEVTAVNPYMIVLLGKVPTRTFYPGHTFKDLKGRVHWRRGRQVLVTYHPAATLYNKDKLPEYQEHFERIREVVNARGGTQPVA